MCADSIAYTTTTKTITRLGVTLIGNNNNAGSQEHKMWKRQNQKWANSVLKSWTICKTSHTYTHTHTRTKLLVKKVEFLRISVHDGWWRWRQLIDDALSVKLLPVGCSAFTQDKLLTLTNAHTQNTHTNACN